MPSAATSAPFQVIRVTIPQIQPQRPVIPQHPPHLPEHADHLGNVLIRRRLKSDLPIHTVIAQAEVRRARDDRLDAAVTEGLGFRQCVAAEKAHGVVFNKSYEFGMKAQGPTDDEDLDDLEDDTIEGENDAKEGLEKFRRRMNGF